MKSCKENEIYCLYDYELQNHLASNLGRFYDSDFIENEWTEELKTKKEIETAKYLIQTGDFSFARRLIERLNKRAGKTLQGF